MSTKTSSQPKPFNDMASLLPNVADLTMLPRLPTIAEMAEAERLQPTTQPKKRLNDLFDGILGTLDPLLADYQEHPEKYGVETHELLERLIHGSTSLEQLSESERRLLNLATFDFAQAPKPKPEVVVVEPKKEEPAEDDELSEETEAEEQGPGPVPGVDVPVTELPAYWWLTRR